MTIQQSELGSSVIQWLVDGDPAIRWQTMQDLLGSPIEEVATERARVATEGMGAQLLALQSAHGSWAGVTGKQGWEFTMHALTFLREMGLDPMSDEAQLAIGLVRDNVKWRGWDWDGNWRGLEFVGNPFFAGEVEPCINGQVAASGAYFGQDIQRIIDRLLNEQLADGGWNCEAENGSTRSSFHTTICVLEALLEIEQADGVSTEIREIRLRGQEYLLERHLLRRQSTGEMINADWTRFSFPTWWHYDVLRGLEYLRRAKVTPDERVSEAIELVKSKCSSDSR